MREGFGFHLMDPTRKLMRLLLLLMALAARSSLAADTGSIAFETGIRPIFKASCFHCHGEDDVKKGGLDVRLVR